MALCRRHLDMEKVSVYIPCYNAEKTIGECLEGVMRQSYPVDEIIIIDDGCRDATPDIVSRYPVRVIRHAANKGLTASRNTAFREARNEFVAAIDADCVPDAEWLGRLMACFGDPDVAGAGGMLVERHRSAAADKWRGAHMAQSWGNEAVLDPPFLYGCNTVFRKQAVLSVGSYSDIFRNNYEDVDISRRLFDNGFRLAYEPTAAVEHLRRDSVISVLNTYWNWHYYRNLTPQGCSGLVRRAAFALGTAGDPSFSCWRLARQDWQNKSFGLFCIDLLFFSYLPLLTFNGVLKIWKIPASRAS
jgi:glycosyltransferase involved in cell wall biosynthesis